VNQDVWMRLVLAALATWRITHLLAYEDGPGNIIFRERHRLGSGQLGKLADCFYCLSFWVAAPAAYLVTHRWSEWPVFWVAISGAACLLEKQGNQPVSIQPIEREGEQSELLPQKP